MDLEKLIETISGLSDDPDKAFFEYEEQRRTALQERLELDSEGWGNERKYIDELIAFISVFGKNDYIQIGIPPDTTERFSSFYMRLTQEIERAKLTFALREALRSREVSDRVIVLTDESKAAIRALIEALKERLENLEMTEAKRRALFSKLNSFLNELDQNLTKTEAFFSFVVDASRTFAEAGAEFKPLAERIDRILDMIDDGKKWVESLPGFRKPKQIEAPRKQIEGPSEGETD